MQSTDLMDDNELLIDDRELDSDATGRDLVFFHFFFSTDMSHLIQGL